MEARDAKAAWEQYQDLLKQTQEVFTDKVFVCHECERSLMNAPGHSEFTTAGGVRIYYCTWCSGNPKTKAVPE